MAHTGARAGPDQSLEQQEQQEQPLEQTLVQPPQELQLQHQLEHQPAAMSVPLVHLQHQQEQWPDEQQHHHAQQQQHQQHQHHQQQGQHQGPLRPPVLSPQAQHHASVLANAWGESERRAALGALVRTADSVDSLGAVWLTLRATAGAAELAVMFNRLAGVCEPRAMSVSGVNTAKVLLRELLIASEDKMPSMAGPEFVYIIAALAKLRAAPDTAWLNRWLAVSRHRLSRLTPAQLVICLRALHRLDMTPADVRSCIAFPAWAHNLLASLRPRLDQLSGFDSVKLVHGLADLGYKPPRSFLEDLAAAVEPKLAGLDSVYLAALLTGFAALKFEPQPEFMRAVLGEVYAKLPLFDDKDLAAALTAFCSMRRMLRGQFLADFVAQVAGKLPTFSTKALAGVVAALGQLGYKPGPEWFAQVSEAFRGRLLGARPHVIAIAAWGLAGCGHDPEPWFVQEVMAAASPGVRKCDLADLVMLVQALAAFSYRPAPGSAAHTARLRFFERLCYAVSQRPMHPKHALVVLESMCEAGMPPDPRTTDHLVAQLVQGGLQHAPVASLAGVLQVLQAAQHTPGQNFLNNYAYCIKAVSTALSAAQLASAMRSLAASGFTPGPWWLVQMLAIAHSRVTEFDAPAAATLLCAVAQLHGQQQQQGASGSGSASASAGSGGGGAADEDGQQPQQQPQQQQQQQWRLPSPKWVHDFSPRFWGPLLAAEGGAGAGQPPEAAAGGGGGGGGFSGGQRAPRRRALTGPLLAQGLWGSVATGFRPSEAEWAAWEGAAARLGWELPLEGAQQAVLAYQAAGRIMPRQLSQRLQAVQEAARAAQRAEVEAATAARAAAAAQLRQQQLRLRAAMSAVAAHQAGADAGAGQQQQQRPEGARTDEGSPEQAAAAQAPQALE